MKLTAGQSIGHKRIERIEPTEVVALRLKITEFKASPIIRRFAAYGEGI